MLRKQLALETKANKSERTIEGYASMFGNVDDGGDVIEKGAFKSTLKERKGAIVHLFNHDMDKLVGNILTLKEDQNGLAFKTRVSKTDIGDRVLEWAEDGSLKGNSIGFYLSQRDYTDHYDEPGKNPGDGRIRTIHSISMLAEISSVSVPMNRGAINVSVSKSLESLLRSAYDHNPDRLSSQDMKALESLAGQIESILAGDHGKSQADPPQDNNNNGTDDMAQRLAVMFKARTKSMALRTAALSF